MIIEDSESIKRKERESLYSDYIVRDWVDPLIGVEYLILETMCISSGGVSMTPRLNPDGSLRVRNINQNK